MLEEFRAFVQGVKQTGRLMVGVPDYEAYVRHCRTVHPDLPAMSYEDFFRERQNSRYGIGEGRFIRCC